MARLKGASKSDLFHLPPEDFVIVTDPKHPLFDERALLDPTEKMILNIAAKGVLEPVLARRNGETLEVVAGRQRVKAAIEANKRLVAEGKEPIRVPVVIKRGDDADMFGVVISENEIRLDDSPLTKAKKLQRFLDMGRGEDEAAILFGVTKTSIKNWLALLDLDPKVQKSVESGAISASAASKLSGLSRDEQVSKLDELEAEGGGKRATVEKVRAVATGKPLVKRPGLKELTEAMNDPNIPNDVRDVLKWVTGARKTRPW